MFLIKYIIYIYIKSQKIIEVIGFFYILKYPHWIKTFTGLKKNLFDDRRRQHFQILQCSHSLGKTSTMARYERPAWPGNAGGEKIIFTRCTAKLLNKSNVMVLSCYFKIKMEVREIGGSFNWKRKAAYLLIWTRTLRWNTLLKTKLN
jgi:hypothetical protein